MPRYPTTKKSRAIAKEAEKLKKVRAFYCRFEIKFCKDVSLWNDPSSYDRFNKQQKEKREKWIKYTNESEKLVRSRVRTVTYQVRHYSMHIINQ
jgi:hypothetical protein